MKAILRFSKKTPGYLHALLSKIGLGAVIYRLEMRMMLAVLGWNWVQKGIFGKRVRLIGRFLSETGLDSQFDPSEFVRFNLAGSAARHWWFDAFLHWGPREFDRVVKVQGWEHFEGAHKRGKGIILVHHHLKIAHLAWDYLERLGFDDRTTIGKLPGNTSGNRGIRSKTGDSGQKTVLLNYARQLQSAREVLSRGGVARIVPDGFRGSSSGTEFLFFNRLRVFRAGFADLALLTGAQIVPVSVTMNEKARFTITFHPALHVPQGTDRKRQSALLVQSYVTYIEEQWKDPSLCFMSIPNVRKFLNIPVEAQANSG